MTHAAVLSTLGTGQMDRGALRLQLVKHEGLRLKAYTDTAGKVTVGVGRNLTDVGLSEAEAYFLLENDVDRVELDLVRKFPEWAKLDDVRQLVLADMAFNVGIYGLLGFKQMLRAVEDRRFSEAARQMLDSRWHDQVGLRAETLAAMMDQGR